MQYLINKFDIDTSNASMFWVLHNKEDDTWYLSCDCAVLDNNRVKAIPTFIFEDIVNMFPNYRMSTCTGGISMMVETLDKSLIKVIAKSPLDAAYQMLCKLLREKLL